MQRIAVAFACIAIVAAAVARTPGPYVGLGFALAAIGTGIVGFERRSAPGALRLWAAAAITIGALAFVLGASRVVLAVLAIDHVATMLPPIAT